MNGIIRLARFRPDGFAAFPATSQALLNSLAPLLAFPLIGGLITLGQGAWRAGLADVLATVIGLLAPLIVTEFFARRWGRGARWLRLAVAFNWCQWVLPMLLVAMVLVLWLLAQFGLPMNPGVVGVCFFLLVGYGIGLHWFLFRVGLDLSRGRAALLVLVMDLLTSLLVIGPRLFAGAA